MKPMFHSIEIKRSSGGITEVSREDPMIVIRQSCSDGLFGNVIVVGGPQDAKHLAEVLIEIGREDEATATS